MIVLIIRIIPVVSKKCSDDLDDHMETVPDNRKQPGSLQNLHDRPDRPDGIEFYPDDRDDRVNFEAIRVICDRLGSVSI